MNPLEQLLATLTSDTDIGSFVWPADGKLYRREDALVPFFSARAVYVEYDTEAHAQSDTALLRISHTAVATGPPRARGVIIVSQTNTVCRLEHHGMLKLTELQAPNKEHHND